MDFTTPHAEYTALTQDLKNLVQGRSQFLGGEADFEVQTFPGSVSSQQITVTWRADPDRHVLQYPSPVERPMAWCQY